MVALGLFALEAAQRPADPGDPLSPCVHPIEVEAAGEHTRRVSCASEPGGAPVRGPARVLFGLGIDPNRADAATLEALPGVGPSRAAAIVAGRADGAYRSLRDLGRVHGIGPVTLRRAASWLSFEGKPPQAARSEASLPARSEPKASGDRTGLASEDRTGLP